MNQRPSYLEIWSCLALLVATAFPIGCQFAPKKTPSGWNWGSEEKLVVPDRILAIWTDTVLRQPNQPGVRGFGGRVFFYEKEQSDPIEVDGKLVVFVFDGDDHDPDNQKPLRKYVIEADDFSKHMSKTSIGPAYSVWLPWGDVKGPTMRLSIIARFEGRKGGTTLSDPTIKLLPGVEGKVRKNPPSPSDKPAVDFPLQAVAGGVQRAGYTEPTKLAGANQMPERLLEPERKTQTIEIPPSFQRHFQGSDVSPVLQGASQLTPEITRSQVTTEVIDARSQKLGTFKKAFVEPAAPARPLTKSPASRLEILRSGKSLSKKISDSTPSNDTQTSEP